MMGKKSRDKGNRFEREVVDVLRRHGFTTAQRVPLSGAAGGAFVGDVMFSFNGTNVLIECKVRADGFSKIYDWLGEHYALAIKADNKDPLLVLRLEDAANLLGRTS